MAIVSFRITAIREFPQKHIGSTIEMTIDKFTYVTVQGSMMISCNNTKPKQSINMQWNGMP